MGLFIGRMIDNFTLIIFQGNYFGLGFRMEVIRRWVQHRSVGGQLDWEALGDEFRCELDLKGDLQLKAMLDLH